MPSKLALFIFAHQDDEFAAQQLIEDSINDGLEVVCIFTTQAPEPTLDLRRNQESARVLISLGVNNNNLVFLGQKLQIQDGHLIEHLKDFSVWLRDYFIKFTPAIIWVPAWE
jgi:LmbE family N-acetylglucosaminyl deacetylase